MSNPTISDAPSAERLARHHPPPELVSAQVREALAEDVGDGDLTAGLLLADARACAEVISRDEAVLCGAQWFEEVFRQLDPGVVIDWELRDGERVQPGQRLCSLEGNLRQLLTGERTALNYLQLLSGTATRARRYADAVAGLPVRILDTRKTLPGLRRQQKYAVLCGGCDNHRMGLFDAILIKENHICAAGSISAAVAAARRLAGGVPVEIEVESLDELREALEAGVERVLLDNFGLPELRRAVELTAGRSRLEASGGITRERLRVIAETGVDDISVGGLTKHVEAVDLSMRLVS
ncbi:carboxylating nicotinate-nucleotide diphosphorylase [Halochromatium glycolicum]|jgi:nicotinate-nucleotide pyrophosphorylase (carboxylating)|uniref:Probable nicotinate-nucleotide pyrophosphorylase [carboxylating] n=1 Tax=Halochromatium glycolicum TaxID=85075 RepID=A0AAJ0U6Y3_9GAMM|nr:carboxylating nicotinate-nucleotide diphosphorylase [Halochromatium glycolicum]MBK1706333.1 nicotinate-nucleotide diphosphorylase (carboxylating) [Halochromatium glycolicum]